MSGMQRGTSEPPAGPSKRFFITDVEMHELTGLIYRQSGIVLAADKKSLVSSRLYKRLKALGLDAFGEYLSLLRSPEGARETVAMIDEMTTNKTDFFREPQHFEYLTAAVLPAMALGEWSMLNIWSAGCSTGEEPYTLAMVLAEYFGGTRNFRIIATDLSTQVLQVARQGVYANALGRAIPAPLRRKYTMTGQGAQAHRFRIVPELRERVSFKSLNLVSPGWDIPGGLHMIFCRNVMIYFDAKTRGRLIAKFRAQLRPEGHLFIGHSETLASTDRGFLQVRPTIYQMCRDVPHG
jgi:chemotaxis protein methyltransferase CheR